MSTWVPGEPVLPPALVPDDDDRPEALGSGQPAWPGPAHPRPTYVRPTDAPPAHASPAPPPAVAPAPDPFGWATLGVQPGGARPGGPPAGPATVRPLGTHEGSAYPRAAYPGAHFPGAHFPGSAYPGSAYPGSVYPGSVYPGSASSGSPAAWVPGHRGAELPASTRRWNAVGVVAAVLIVVLILGGNLWGFVRGGSPPGPNRAGYVRVAAPEDLPPPVATGQTYPTPGFEEAGGPLGVPTLTAPPSTAYAFQAVQDGEPVAWSPCRPIHVVVNPAGAPESFPDDVLAALGDISAASGLVFVYDGITDEVATADRAPYQPERYGDRWAPVIVRFADESEVPELAGDVAGLTVVHTMSNRYTGRDHITTAEVWIDREMLSYARQDGVYAYVAVLRHELAHAVGLDHVDDSSQLMYPTTSGNGTFQDGDLAGLARLGAGSCARSL